MIQVVPAIIPVSFEDLKSKLEKVSPFVNKVQVDVMDGKYTPPISWPYNSSDKDFKFPLNSQISIEVDMMVEKPEDQIDKFLFAGAVSLIIHIESTNKLDEIIKKLHENKIKIGIALRPETPNSELESCVEKIDFVQFMGNQKIGYQGVELDERVLGKIKDLRKQHPGLIIGVDIGVNFKTAPKLISAGANKLVSGSSIFNSEDIGKAIEKLKQIK